MKKKKWIAVAIVIALIAAAAAFAELSGIREDIGNKIEEKKMWESTGDELVAHVNKDVYFTDRYGEIDSRKIIEKQITYAEDGQEIKILTLSCETESHVLQIYASKHGGESWRYRVESVMLK